MIDIDSNDIKEYFDKEIIAGSFITNLFLQSLSTIDNAKKITWNYDDIDVWIYNKNGLDNNTFIHNYENTEKIHVKNQVLNLIKSKSANNIKNLLNSFDIPCCQFGYVGNKFYVSIYGLYSLITGINIMNTKKPYYGKILLELNYKATAQVFTDCKKYSVENYNESIICGVNMDNEIVNKLRYYMNNLKATFKTKDTVKKIGAKYSMSERKFFIPSNVSIDGFIDYINGINKSNIKLCKNLSEWNDENILLINTNNAKEFWCMILLLYNQYQNKKLYSMLCDKKIKLEDVIKILILCKTKEDIIKCVSDYEDCDINSMDEHNDNGFCYTEENELMNNVNNICGNFNLINQILTNRRFCERIKKYEKRNFTFIWKNS